MVLPTSFATSMLAWGMLTFGDVSSAATANLNLPAPCCGTVAVRQPALLLPLPPQLFLCAQSHCLHQPRRQDRQELHAFEPFILAHCAIGLSNKHSLCWNVPTASRPRCLC